MARVLWPYVIFEAQYKIMLHFSRGGPGGTMVIFSQKSATTIF